MSTHSTPFGSFVEPLEARIAPAAANLNLSSLNGTKGFQISGVAEYDSSGASVSGAGDINGDGIGDLIVGAPGVATNGDYTGAVYVVFGSSGRRAGDLNLASLDGTNGFKITGENGGDHFGYSVSAAGDLNGDGIGDLVIGAPQAGPNGNDSGAVYVVFGQSAAFGPALDLATLDGTNGFVVHGAAEGDQAGGAVSDAGDLNGDGFGDIIIGAAGADVNGANSGASYVIFGRASGSTPIFELSALDGGNGIQDRRRSHRRRLGHIRQRRRRCEWRRIARRAHWGTECERGLRRLWKNRRFPRGPQPPQSRWHRWLQNHR
jgi:hypothetical protein